ncbi:hypothetical protein BHH47_06105 [Salmonella enterica]|uniref:Uncharacterized protein n=1 Tax=Salmonella enterica TaxID=28901 RepID=A0A704QUI3_SALER|nr:hypothetical protein [Salmonella enterica]EAX5942294.1 hypothetical protein [Salmonella enterica]EAY0665550.1 hypothetical protein [Salmonella enterica]EAY0682348.1 hypothetical protein [Salmonella enterica]EAY1794272.1 hypothetical protein [Salmonella enterica]
MLLTRFIQAQRFQHDNGKIFICTKMRQRSHFSNRSENKKPRRKEARFLQRDAGGSRETHCVMSTAEVYAFCAERAISARILMYLSMDQMLCSVYKLLFIYTVINYNVFDTMCYAGAAS